MKPCLADINALLPILIRTHAHQEPAMAWWDRQPAGRVGLCRFVQLGIVRLLANPRVMGPKAATARVAWELTVELLADERLEFWPEPPGLEQHYTGLLRYSAPKPGLVSDAYLAAFALSRKAAVASFDRGFRQFGGLDLELLG